MQKKNILLFGDSLTWGAQAGPDGFRFEKEERSAEEIVSGFVEYRNVIDAFNQVWEINFKPKVVIVAPPVIDQKYSSDRYQKDVIGSQKVSEQLSDAYKKLTQEKSELNFDFLDASKVKVSESDGVHLEAEQNQEIAKLYFDYIKQYESI